jgi:hypothetical protein
MVKRTIIIEDNLDDLVKNCQDEVYEDFKEYLIDNLDIDEFDDYYQHRGCDEAFAIADRNVPTSNSEINDLYYLYGDAFDESYENQGLGEIPKQENHRQVTMFYYLEEKTFERMNEIEKNECKDFLIRREELEEEMKEKVEAAELEGIYLDEEELENEKNEKLENYINKDFQDKSL